MDTNTFKQFGMPVQTLPGDSVHYVPVDKDDDGFFETFGKSVVRGFLNVGKGLVGTAEEAIELIPGVEEENFLTKVRANIAAEEEKFEVTPDNALEWGASIIGEALPYMGAAMVGGMYWGPVGAAGVAFSVEGQEAYDNAKKRGATETQANLERGVVGSINATIEALQISKVLKFADKGKFTFKAFKKAAQEKAWKKMAELGGQFGKDALMNSIEEAFEESLQQGVQIVAPALIEGKQALPLREDGTIDTRAILLNIGEAALAGAVVGPLLGTTKAFIPAMVAPDSSYFNGVREAINNSKQSEEWKTARNRELDLQIEQITGETSERTTKTSDIPSVVYHATTKQFEDLPILGESRTGFFEEGEPSGIYYSIDPEKAKAATGSGSNQRIVPGYVSTDKVFIVDEKSADEYKNNEEKVIELWIKEARQTFGKDIETFVERDDNGKIINFLGDKTWKGDKFPSWSIADRLKEEYINKGYDAIYDKRKGDFIVLNSSSIQSKPQYQSYRQLLDWIDSRANELADFRPQHEDTVSKRRGAKKHEAATFLEENKGQVASGDMTPEQLAIGYKTIMQGSLTPEFDIEMSRDQYDSFLKAVINSYPADSFKIDEAMSAFHKLFYEHSLPERSEIESLEPVLGKSIVKKLLGIKDKVKRRQMTFGQKILNGVFEAVNFPRAVLASWDVSFVARQGIMMAFVDRKLWAKSIGSSWRAYLSPEYATSLDMEVRSNPMFDYVHDTLGVPYHDAGTADSDEHFMSKFARNVPGVRASERAYVAAANTLRYKYMYKYLESSWGSGQTKAQHKEMASVIKHLTGYGDVKALKKIKNTLNIFFFSPRLIQARFQSLTDLNPIEVVDGKPAVKFSPAQRMLLGTWVKAVGTGMGVLYLLSLIKGVEVEKDPRSTDFGKVRIGDTRIDFWAGYSQIARLIAQVATGKRKTQSGDFTDAERSDVIVRFLQTKLSPGAGLALDMYRGTDFKGKILEPTVEDVTTQTLARTVPLFLQDLYELTRAQGYGTTTMLGSVAAFHGVGVLTYPETKGSQAMQYKNMKAQEYFDSKWDSLGPISQEMLRTYEPMIDEMDRIADREKLNKQVNARFLKELRNSERKLLRSLPTKMRDQLDLLLVNVGGLSRKIGGDWYLNEKRFNEYQSVVSEQLKEQLPIWLEMDLAPEIKRAFIEDTIDDIKKFARQEIILSANMKDLIRE